MSDVIRQLAQELHLQWTAMGLRLMSRDGLLPYDPRPDIEAALLRAQQVQREVVEQMHAEANAERQRAHAEGRIDDQRYFAYRYGAFSDVLATLRSQEIP